MDTITHPNRRQFIAAAGAGFTVATLPFGNLALAKIDRDARFVLVLARGGLDGLALFPPHGDPDYRKMRGSLALPRVKDGGILRLNNLFGLHPAASQLLPFWERGEMALIPAVATSYRGNQHQEAQIHLDSGLTSPSNPRSGWLNRAIQAMAGDAVQALSLSDPLPLVLAGPDAGGMIRTARTAPSSMPGFQQKVLMLYQEDPLLLTALSQEMGQLQDREFQMTGDDLESDAGAPPVSELSGMARMAARSLREGNGARLAVIEISGWDSHLNQGTEDGTLARRFSSLAGGLEALAGEMGPAWQKTVVIVASEFGRTTAPNDRQGTDHGLASPLMVLGGAVKGGQVLGPWPGLASRTEELSKALQPTEDIRAVFKSVLIRHLGLDAAAVETTVFPGSAKIKPLSGLF